MKRATSGAGSRGIIRIIALGLLAFLVALLMVWPASWNARFLPAGARCATWSGSLWHGACAGLQWPRPGQPPLQLDSLEWRLHPLALLQARVDVDINLAGAGMQASGRLAMGAGGAVTASELSASGQLDRTLLAALPAGWSTQFQAHGVSFELRNRQLQALSGQLTANGLRDNRGTDLGNYQLEFPPQPAAPFRGSLRDAGGPVQLQAAVTVNTDGSWQVDGSTTLRPGSPAQLARALDQLGSADVNGRRPFSIAGTFD